MPVQTTGSRPGPKPKLGTRQTLIDAGANVFHTAGYSATGIQDIVDLAKVPKGSFYHQFQSKEAFCVEVIGAQSVQSLARLRTLLSDGKIAPRDRLISDFARRSHKHQAADCAGGCMFGNLSLEVADHSEAMRESLKAHFREWRDLIEQCIAAAQEDGSIQNPTPASKLAEFTLNSWEGALLRSRTEKTGEALAVFQDIIFNTVLI